MNSQEILGAEIQYFRLDPQYWEPIIVHLKDSGLRCVTTYVQWATHLVGPPDRKNPAGVLDFTGRTNPRLNLFKFLELVEKHGLNLNFRAGPFCCNEMIHGGLPSWLALGDPAIMVWDYANRPTQGYWIAKREGMQPSYLHPTYLDWCAKWLGAVDKIIVPHLQSAGGCVTMINLDNEVSYIVRDSFLDSDYNPVNVAPGGFFQQFLAEKYGSASRLPYPGKFASMRDVVPPRAVPDTLERDLPWYLDWVEFKTWAMARYIAALRRMHADNGVGDVIFMTNLNPHRPEGVPTHLPSFEAATGGGTVGYDFYRGVFMSYSGYHSMARVLKLMNASLAYTWSAEFMSGTWNKVLSSRVSDDHMRFMARCALAHGCKSIAWFMFHDRDCWGDAPVSAHGHARPSLAVLRETAALLFQKISDWDGLIPQGDVAVVYDLAHHQHTAIGDPMPCADNDLHIGKPAIDGVPAGKASGEYEGLFRLVEQAGLQANAVDVLARGQKLRDYPLVLLPGSPILSSKGNTLLGAYVRRGGVLLLSGPWPGRNEQGRSLAFLGLKQPRGHQPVLQLRLGKGTLVWHRDYLAQEKPEEESLAHGRFLAKWLQRCVPQAHVRIRPQQVVAWTDWQPAGGSALFRQQRNLGSAVLHRGKRELILFVLNHYPEAACFELTFPRDPVRALENLDSGEITLLKAGKAVVDIDRKSGQVFRLLTR